MEPIILDSARKHGVADEDIRAALASIFTVTRQGDDRTVYVGFDRNGETVEVGVEISVEGLLLVIHAMRPARNKFLR